MERKRIIIAGILLLTILTLGIEFIGKIKNGGLDSKKVELTNQKTYEQGLWDGFNKAFIYLDHTGQIKDTLKIEITIADSILHAK